MAKKTYIVDGRQFQSQTDYESAISDKALIDKLRMLSKDYDDRKLKELLRKLENREIRFRTLLGEDFTDEIRERIHAREKRANHSEIRNTAKRIEPKKALRTNGDGRTPEQERQFLQAVEAELRKRERLRRFFLLFSAISAIVFLGVFGIYAFQLKRGQSEQEKLGSLIGYRVDASESNVGAEENPGADSYHVRLDEKKEVPDVLEEYKTIYQQHKKLIGWLKFDDKDIGGKYGFPVMQTDDNDYFLTHNSELKTDKNGAIFMDSNCDVLKPSTNFILYGHHMKSGAMFGNLDHYQKESYWKKYPYFDFDTIYEKGTYQVMYVFRSHVYNEDEIAFKYYQFVDCISSTEFDSYMEEMAKSSLYETGVTAQFGDQLITLSTCDYQEEEGRFVVVAKKVKSRQ